MLPSPSQIHSNIGGELRREESSDKQELVLQTCTLAWNAYKRLAPLLTYLLYLSNYRSQESPIACSQIRMMIWAIMSIKSVLLCTALAGIARFVSAASIIDTSESDVTTTVWSTKTFTRVVTISLSSTSSTTSLTSTDTEEDKTTWATIKVTSYRTVTVRPPTTTITVLDTIATTSTPKIATTTTPKITTAPPLLSLSSTSAFRFSNASCVLSCSVLNILRGPVVYTWSERGVSSTFTAATIITIINTVLNTTRTSTVLNPVPPSIDVPPHNSLGTQTNRIGVSFTDQCTRQIIPKTVEWQRDRTLTVCEALTLGGFEV